MIGKTKGPREANASRGLETRLLRVRPEGHERFTVARRRR